MIVIEARLVSSRGPKYDRDLGNVVIVNDGSGTHSRGNYIGTLVNGKRGRCRSGKVFGFSRRSRSAWELLRLMLEDMHKGRQIP